MSLKTKNNNIINFIKRYFIWGIIIAFIMIFFAYAGLNLKYDNNTTKNDSSVTEEVYSLAPLPNIDVSQPITPTIEPSVTPSVTHSVSPSVTPSVTPETTLDEITNTTVTNSPKTSPTPLSRGDITRPEIKSFNPPVEYVDTFIGNITKYTLHPSECGKTPDHPQYGITASGKYVTEHQTIAMGKQIPFGTKVKIEGFNETFIVEDRGGAIKDLCIDIYTLNRADALKWGRQYRKVWILSYENN